MVYCFWRTFLANLETCGDDPVEVAKQFVSKVTIWPHFIRQNNTFKFTLFMYNLPMLVKKDQNAEKLYKRVEFPYSCPIYN